jgi:hypothetical protein
MFGCSAAGGGGGAPEGSAGSGDRNANRDGVTAPDVGAPAPRPGVVQAPPPNLVTVTGDEEGLAADGEPARPANPAPTAVPSAAPAAGAADAAEDATEDDEDEDEDEDAADDDTDEDDDDAADEDEGD